MSENDVLSCSVTK